MEQKTLFDVPQKKGNRPYWEEKDPAEYTLRLTKKERESILNF